MPAVFQLVIVIISYKKEKPCSESLPITICKDVLTLFRACDNITDLRNPTLPAVGFSFYIGFDLSSGDEKSAFTFPALFAPFC